eukprot:TRINITY_DN1261_c0_g1_i1.p1 TRINITY_DN1261_c0_g1~~TRINITY_DN1261_c0_g1_i1.p1  ORF type:complete len:134 (-),score=17.71 TRINITY_DN1261_c0_g1_i1:116-517(-)
MGNTKSRKSKLVGQVKPILHEVLEQVATNFNNEDETTDIVACVAVIDPRDEKTPVLISMATPGRNLATGEDSKMVGIVANLMKTVVMFGLFFPYYFLYYFFTQYLGFFFRFISFISFVHYNLFLFIFLFFCNI